MRTATSGRLETWATACHRDSALKMLQELGWTVASRSRPLRCHHARQGSPFTSSSVRRPIEKPWMRRVSPDVCTRRDQGSRQMSEPRQCARIDDGRDVCVRGSADGQRESVAQSCNRPFDAPVIDNDG